MLIFLAEELVQELIKSYGLIQSQTAVLAARIDSLEADVRVIQNSFKIYFFNHELDPKTNSSSYANL